MKTNPEKTGEELFRIYEEELKEFDFDNERCRVFVIEVERRFAGYVWLSIRDSRDSWELTRPMWIYDITLNPDYRGRGLGRVLMKQAEEWAVEQKRNLGLFVHAHNEPAIRLYEGKGYVVKSTPMTLRFSEMDSAPRLPRRLEFIEDDYRNNKRGKQIAHDRFARLVRFSEEANDEEIATAYQRFVDSYTSDELEHSRFVASREGKTIGVFWVGQAPFRKDVGMIYEHALVNSDRRVQQALLAKAVRWAQERGLSALYILLHAMDDFRPSVLESAGFVIPGYFMEKRLI